MADTRPPAPEAAPAGGTGRRPSRVLATEELGRLWDLGEWRDWRRTPHGRTNVSHFVTTDRGRFVVRVSNGRKTEASMTWEVALLEHLRTRGYPAPKVVPTRGGEAWAWVGGSLCCITERIPGEFPDPENPAQRRETVRALAWFHREARHLPEGTQPSARSRVPTLASGPALLGQAQALVAEILGPADVERFSRAREALAPAFPVAMSVSADGAALPEMVTHGSFGYTAVLFEGARITGVLDYERAARELRALDLGYTLRALARSRAAEGAWDTARLSELAAAYGSLDSLTAAEVDHFPAVLSAQRLIKVANKAANFLTKHAAVPQQEKDGRKLLETLEQEVARVAWIAAHEAEVVAAMAAGAR